MCYKVKKIFNVRFYILRKYDTIAISKRREKQMAEKQKKVGEIFSDYNTNSNIKHAQVVALNVIKKTNTLEVILYYDEYIEI